MRCPTANQENAELLLAHVSRTLDAERAAVLEEHMARCAACRDYYAAQLAVWAALDHWEAPPVSADFDRRLYRRIEAVSRPWDLARVFRAVLRAARGAAGGRGVPDGRHSHVAGPLRRPGARRAAGIRRGPGLPPGSGRKHSPGNGDDPGIQQPGPGRVQPIRGCEAAGTVSCPANPKIAALCSCSRPPAPPRRNRRRPTRLRRRRPTPPRRGGGVPQARRPMGPPLGNPANPAVRLYQASPEERERALEKLPPAMQEQIRKQLQRFDAMPPEQQRIIIAQNQRFAVAPAGAAAGVPAPVSGIQQASAGTPPPHRHGPARFRDHARGRARPPARKRSLQKPLFPGRSEDDWGFVGGAAAAGEAITGRGAGHARPLQGLKSPSKWLAADKRR